MNRRDFLRTAVGTLLAARLPKSSAQSPSHKNKKWSEEFPGDWPALSEEEKLILQIPLNDEQINQLLDYKISTYVFKDHDVMAKIKDAEFIPEKWRSWAKYGIGTVNFLHMDGMISSGAKKMGISDLYLNISKQFNHHAEWDQNSGEPKTVENVWRRFWEQLTNHYYEEVFKHRVTIHAKYPQGFDAADQAARQAYNSDEVQKDKDKRKKIEGALQDIEKDREQTRKGNLYAELYLGKDNAKDLIAYENAHFANVLAIPDYSDTKTLNNDNVAFAKITRGGPQLNFPNALPQVAIRRDFLKITRDDLEKALQHEGKPYYMNVAATIEAAKQAAAKAQQAR